MLEAHALTYTHTGARQPILRGVNLLLPSGCLIGLSGPSGAGKSTLGRLLAGWLAPQEGRITLDGHPLPPHGPLPVQLAHQSAELAVDPLWSLRRVLANGGSVAPQTMADFGIQRDWLKRRAHEVSGGQLQRIALARLLTNQPRYLICDEITAALDALAAESLWQILLHYRARHNLGLVVISHDADLLALLTSERYQMENGVLYRE